MTSLRMALDGLARDDAPADGRLDGHLEHLARDDLAQLLGEHLAARVGLVLVDDEAQRVDGLAGEQDVELDELGRRGSR